MLKNEAALWTNLKSATAGSVLWTRIENPISPGLPDLHGVRRGQEAWVELKVAKNDLHISFEPTQLVWYVRYTAHQGTSAFVLVAFPSVMSLYQPQAFLRPAECPTLPAGRSWDASTVRRRERVVVHPVLPPVATFSLRGQWGELIDKVFKRT